MKISVINTQKNFIRSIIKEGMQTGGFLKKLPVDERKLFLKAAELNINLQPTLQGGQKSVENLITRVKKYGVAKGIIKDRPGFMSNPIIRPFLKNIQKLKESLIKYLHAK